MKAIYETRLEVDPAVQDEYLIWLREHMQALVTTGSFERAELFTLEQEGPQVLVVQYIARDRKSIDEYLNVHAPALRADGLVRFGGRFKIERRILNFQEAFPA